MKKILLSAVAVAMTMSVNAQEIGAITTSIAEGIGLTKDAKVPVAGGTEIVSTDNVKCTLLFDQAECGMTGLSTNNVLVNGEDFGSETGIQGNVNGPGAALGGTFPESGCIYNFEVSKDGYLYIIHKGTNSKGYVVYEEKASRPSYKFAMSDQAIVRGFDLSEIDGATFDDPEGGTYVNTDYTLLTPGETTVKDADGNKIPVAGYVSDMPSGTSVIKFQVFEGLNYQVMATGSKMTLAGFVFDEDGTTKIEINTADNGVLTLMDNSATGITSIEAERTVNANAPIYNLAGQKVSKSYKGIVIQNGRKFINK